MTPVHYCMNRAEAGYLNATCGISLGYVIAKRNYANSSPSPRAIIMPDAMAWSVENSASWPNAAQCHPPAQTCTTRQGRCQTVGEQRSAPGPLWPRLSDLAWAGNKQLNQLEVAGAPASSYPTRTAWPGCNNRRYFDEVLDSEWRRLRETIRITGLMNAGCRITSRRSTTVWVTRQGTHWRFKQAGRCDEPCTVARRRGGYAGNGGEEFASFCAGLICTSAQRFARLAEQCCRRSLPELPSLLPAKKALPFF